MKGDSGAFRSVELPNFEQKVTIQGKAKSCRSGVGRQTAAGVSWTRRSVLHLRFLGLGFEKHWKAKGRQARRAIPQPYCAREAPIKALYCQRFTRKKDLEKPSPAVGADAERNG